MQPATNDQQQNEQNNPGAPAPARAPKARSSKNARAQRTLTRESGSAASVNIPGPDDAATNTDLQLVTAGGRVISEAEAADIRQMVFDTVGQYLDESRFALLMQPPPKYAIQYREGGSGTMYPYLKHGYVKLKMTQIFGIDWSHELLPVFAGEPYRLTASEDARLVTKNPSVTVYGALVVNVRGNKRGAALLTIKRTGFGSVEWRNKQELGDALKGAQSDAFKVAAATLGPALGLTLYWDDDKQLETSVKQEQTQQELDAASAAYQQQLANAAAMAANKPPANFAEVLQRAKIKYSIGMPKVVAILQTSLKEVNAVVAADPAGCWQRIIDAMEPKADAAALVIENSPATQQQPDTAQTQEIPPAATPDDHATAGA